MQLKQHLAENYLTLNAYIGKEDLKSIIQAFSSRNQKSKNKKQTNKQTKRQEQKQPKSCRRVEITKNRNQRKLKHKGNIRRSMKPKASSLKISMKLIKLLAKLTKEKKENINYQYQE